MVPATAFAIGELILTLQAYFIRDWFTLQIVAHAPMLVLLGLYFLVPESTRWLLAKGYIFILFRQPLKLFQVLRL